MTNQQFLQALLFMAWFLSTSILSAFSFLFGEYALNTDYPLFIFVAVFVNVSCAVYWFHSHVKRQGGAE